MEMRRKIIVWICEIAVFAAIAPLALTSKASAYERGDTIEFGSYPQTRIADESLIADLNAAGSEVEWSSLGYNATGGTDFAFYKDVVYRDKKYRAVLFTMYRTAYGYGSANDYGLQSARGYVTNTVHWFRFDPVSWTVLDTEKGLLIADAVLDSQAINDVVYKKSGSSESYADPQYQYYANDYAHSTVRTWLRDKFLPTAFSDREASVLTPKALSDATEGMPEQYNIFAYPSTEDAVFLLSYAEAYNEDYFENRALRSRKGTDYARAQGLNNLDMSSPLDFWFLRSPGDRTEHQTYITLQGDCVFDAVDSNGNDVGICPAIYISLEAYDRLNESENGNSEPELPIPDPYEKLNFTFEDGILTVSGNGAIPAVSDSVPSPFEGYAEDCRVVFVSDGIEAIRAGAFAGLERIETLILNGPIELEADAFSENRALKTVICADSVRFDAASFATEGGIAVYESKDSPHTGALPASCVTFPYSFSDGTLFVDGGVEMDTYDLLDLMTVMCGYYDDVRYVHFNSYTSLDVPFYVYDQTKQTYDMAEDDTLKDVGFSVKISGDEDWEPITFNEFCALAGNGELGTFHLVADLQTGEKVKENAFKIMMDRLESGIQKVLKWIVGLLNYMFNILSRFRGK